MGMEDSKSTPLFNHRFSEQAVCFICGRESQIIIFINFIHVEALAE